MAKTTKTIAATNRSRDSELRKMLEDRRRELAHEVQSKIRDARRDCTKEARGARRSRPGRPLRRGER
jgi:hypothetical protein